MTAPPLSAAPAPAPVIAPSPIAAPSDLFDSLDDGEALTLDFDVGPATPAPAPKAPAPDPWSAKPPPAQPDAWSARPASTPPAPTSPKAAPAPAASLPFDDISSVAIDDLLDNAYPVPPEYDFEIDAREEFAAAEIARYAALAQKKAEQEAAAASAPARIEPVLDAAPAPEPARPPARPGAKPRPRAPVPVIDPEAERAFSLAEPDNDEPGFVKRERQKRRMQRIGRWVMGIGSVLLALLLALQAATTFRNRLAAHFPQTRPALAAACDLLGCKIELPAQIDQLSVETGELQTLGGNVFGFTTLLRNQGSVGQAWPCLEMVLTDANDKPLLRRVFMPRDYLTQAEAAKGFGPRSEQPIKLFFELNQAKPAGYHLAIFYP